MNNRSQMRFTSKKVSVNPLWEILELHWAQPNAITVPSCFLGDPEYVSLVTSHCCNGRKHQGSTQRASPLTTDWHLTMAREETHVTQGRKPLCPGSICFQTLIQRYYIRVGSYTDLSKNYISFSFHLGQFLVTLRCHIKTEAEKCIERSTWKPFQEWPSSNLIAGGQWKVLWGCISLRSGNVITPG